VDTRRDVQRSVRELPRWGRSRPARLFFAGHRFAGTDALTSSRDIVGLWRDDKTIAFLYVVYRPRDPNCCPTGGGKVVRFRLGGSSVRVLDPLPRNR